MHLTVLFFIYINFRKDDRKLEIKINREIRDYTESVFFGLSLRQCIFALAGVIFAMITYFALHGILGTETVSWICILAAAPFVAMGFIKYNGMTAEQFLLVFIRSSFLEKRFVPYESDTLYNRMTAKGTKRRRTL